MEHMLLEEHVADNRGNSIEAAVEGFRAFWPREMPSYVPANKYRRTLFDERTHEANMQAASKSTEDANEIIEGWAYDAGGSYPLLVVVGPEYSTPHAVAFLIAQTAGGKHECFYANTGLGALQCGKGAIRTTLKWEGDMIIRLIEYARSVIMDKDDHRRFVEFIMWLPGHKAACVRWNHVVVDRMLTLAQYAESEGVIVSSPQRGGTCTYNCILWLVGGVMMAKKHAAAGEAAQAAEQAAKKAAGKAARKAAAKAEMEMKKGGIRALASFIADDAGDMETRECMRVMEAVAHTYAATEWCKPEVAELNAAIAAQFETMYTLLTNRASRSNYRATLSHSVGSVAGARITLDLTSSPFMSVSGAASWADAAYGWLNDAGWERPSRLNEPIFHAFVHKARAVLCASRLPESTHKTPADVLAIVTFLDRCRGTIHDETARGMLVRCARMAAAALAARHVAESTEPRKCKHKSELYRMPHLRSSALPWVVNEHRALAREAHPLLGELIAHDDIKSNEEEAEEAEEASSSSEVGFGTGSDQMAPAAADSAAVEARRTVVVGRLSMRQHKRLSLEPDTWANIERVMSDPPRAAFNLAVLFMNAWGDEGSSRGRMTFHRGNTGMCYYDGADALQHTFLTRERISTRVPDDDDFHAFHANTADRGRMADYMRLSIHDMSTASGAQGASTLAAPETQTRMAIVVMKAEGVVQSDVSNLASWANRESSAWTRRAVPQGIGGGIQDVHETVGRMARARSMAYCAAKYLEPSSRAACEIENLDAIVAERASHREADTLTRTMSAILAGDVGLLALLVQGSQEQPGATRLAMQYAVRKSCALDVVKALAPNADHFGEPAVRLTPLRMTEANGTSAARLEKSGWHISVRQPPTGPSDGSFVAKGAACRRLVFSCTGGVVGAVSRALRMANVPSLHWQYEPARKEGRRDDLSTGKSEVGHRSEIEVNNAVITFVSTDESLTAELKSTDGRKGVTYEIDPAPSEWSSLWYTTVLAAVFPVRERETRVLSLAVFVCTDESHEMAGKADAVYFSADTRTGVALHETQRGTHFVVPFDAAGVMPVCTPMQAHTLFCAYSRGSICAVRLLPMLAARRAELPATAPASCIYGTYAAYALRYGEECGGKGAVVDVTDQTRALPQAQRAWCISTLEGTGARIVPRPKQREGESPPSPMHDVAIEEVRGVLRVKGAHAAATTLTSERRRLETMRAACRAKWRFWFGTVVYGADERATAFLAAAIAARENLREGGDERLGVMMAQGCVAPYACAAGSARETFEAASGRFLTVRQEGLLTRILQEKRMAVQLNMGFGKSAVVVPMLVLELTQHKTEVIVTQPAHLVAPALRIIAAAVAARPFVDDEPIIVTTSYEPSEARTRRVIVCSSADLQGAISHSEQSTRWMFEDHRQTDRAHIADEIDETSDPLTCERSETVGAPRAHYDPSVDVLTYHRAVCELVGGREAGAQAHKATGWYGRLAAVHAATRQRKLNVNFGLVATKGVYLAVPYKYAKTPVHDARYSDVNAGGTFTAQATLEACERGSLPDSGMLALRRALRQSVGSAEAHAIIELLTSSDRTGEASEHKRQKAHQTFMLYAVLVALPQVVCYAHEKVTSFLDVFGIADVFAAFSGTMALSIPLPNLITSATQPPYPDSRADFMPHRNDGGMLTVTHDEIGNALVKANIRRARCRPVSGEHDAKRAHAVIAVLEDLRKTRVPKEHKGTKGRERQMVVVDASGEFGVMPEVPGFLRRGRCFREDGTLEPKTDENAWLVYFDHRNSRGTDAELDADADGWAVVDLETSTTTSVAQAMYRLRGIDYGRQTVSFIVCGTADAKLDGRALYARLALNETERAARTVTRGRIQLERASRHYSAYSRRDFVHEVTHSSAADAGHHQQMQMQMQEQEQVQSRTDTCLSVSDEYAYYHIDPLAVYERWESGDSALRASLLETSVHVSPLLVYTGNDNGNIAHELAFVVIASGSSRTTVGMCALMEVWTRLTGMEHEEAATGAVSAVSAYSARGKLLRGARASAGDVLFGTFLCGRTLPREDQKSLLAYLTRRYADPQEREAIHSVLACLVSARLLTPHAGLLRPLFVTAKWAESAESAESTDPVAAFVRSVMSAVSPAFGRPRLFV